MLKNKRGLPRQLYQVVFYDSENEFDETKLKRNFKWQGSLPTCLVQSKRCQQNSPVDHQPLEASKIDENIKKKLGKPYETVGNSIDLQGTLRGMIYDWVLTVRRSSIAS